MKSTGFKASFLYFLSFFTIVLVLILASSNNARQASAQLDRTSNIKPSVSIFATDSNTSQSNSEQSDSNTSEKFKSAIVHRVYLKSAEKVIALTFDDGPVGDTTLQVLDILEQYKVKATFFWVGENLQQYPYIGRTIVHQGHAIGNHTWSHSYQAMNEDIVAQEIDDTSTLISELIGIQTRLFRPPLGRTDNGLVAYAQQENYAVILWSIDSGDGVGYPGVKTIVNNVVNSAHSGGIILLHDAPWYRQKTVEALPQIIEGLQAQGYRFVTIPELLEMSE